MNGSPDISHTDVDTLLISLQKQHEQEVKALLGNLESLQSALAEVAESAMELRAWCQELRFHRDQLRLLKAEFDDTVLGIVEEVFSF